MKFKKSHKIQILYDFTYTNSQIHRDIKQQWLLRARGSMDGELLFAG